MINVVNALFIVLVLIGFIVLDIIYCRYVAKKEIKEMEKKLKELAKEDK